MFYLKIRYKNRNNLEISHLWAFLKELGNDLAMVANSVICGVLLPNNSFHSCKNSIFFYFPKISSED